MKVSKTAKTSFKEIKLTKIAKKIAEFDKLSNVFILQICYTKVRLDKERGHRIGSVRVWKRLITESNYFMSFDVGLNSIILSKSDNHLTARVGYKPPNIINVKIQAFNIELKEQGNEDN